MDSKKQCNKTLSETSSQSSKLECKLEEWERKAETSTSVLENCNQLLQETIQEQAKNLVGLSSELWDECREAFAELEECKMSHNETLLKLAQEQEKAKLDLTNCQTAGFLSNSSLAKKI